MEVQEEKMDTLQAEGEKKKRGRKKKEKPKSYSHIDNELLTPEERKLRNKYKKEKNKARLIRNAIQHELIEKKIIVPKLRSDYCQIILTSNKQRRLTLYRTFKLKNAYEVFRQMSKDNKKVKFPVKYTYTPTSNGFRDKKEIIEANYEMLLIRRKRPNETAKPTMFPNEYGKMEENVLYDDRGVEWIIVDKEAYPREETFSVTGYHPSKERKTYDFIFDKFLKPYASKKDKSFVIRIYAYANKVVFLNDKNDVTVVTCKNIHDSSRYFTMLEEDIKKAKYVNLIPIGRLRKRDASWLISLISEKTGKTKLQIITQRYGSLSRELQEAFSAGALNK